MTKQFDAYSHRAQPIRCAEELFAHAVQRILENFWRASRIGHAGCGNIVSVRKEWRQLRDPWIASVRAAR